MKHLILAVCFLFTLNCYAQDIVWQRSLGGQFSEEAYSIEITTDGGYVMAGYASSNDGDVSGSHGGWDFWVVKLDGAGNIEWQKCLGGGNWDYAESIQQTTDAGYIVAGGTNSYNGDVTGIHGGYDAWVVKLDSAGNLQWEKCLGGSGNEHAVSIQQTTDGGYGVAGHTNSIDGDVFGNMGGYDLWVVKLDDVGNVQWQKCLGGSNEDLAESMQQTSDGGFVVAGYTQSNDGDVLGFQGGNDSWVVKLDSLSNIQWQRCLGGTSADFVSAIQQTADMGYVVTATTFSNDGDVSGNHGEYDFWVVKLDATGNIMWQKCLGGTDHDQAEAIQQTVDGGFVIAGTTFSNDGDVSGNNGLWDFWIVKLDNAGDIQWQKCLGGTSWDRSYSVKQTTDGNYVVVGWSNSTSGDVSGNNGSQDFWVVKINDHHNLIMGKLFFDVNSNNIHDAGELSLNNRKVIEINTGNFGFSGQTGTYYVAVVDSGNFVVDAESLNYYTTAPASHAAYFNGFQLSDSLNDFAFQPSGVINDLCVSITPSGPFRMGFDANYVINFNNVGTTTLNNCSIIFFPDSYVTYVNSSAAPLSVTPDSIIWNIGTLTSFQSGSITVTVNVNLGTPIGTIINSGVRIEPVTGDANPSCNTNYFEVITTGSYDPNDILVNRATLLSTEFPTPPILEYIIRFQNTGNDTAFTVKVMNNLTDKLDLNSFEWVASSHPMDITYEAHARLLTFTFDNILLPDSIVNEPESHGFIRYRIKPVSTLTVGDSINNSAAIYFDYNQPVITNTAVTSVILPTGEAALPVGEKKLKLFPNPATNELTVSVNLPADKISILEVFDVLGQKVYEKEIRSEMQHHQFTVNINHLPDGMYILYFESANVKQQSKFVKL